MLVGYFILMPGKTFWWQMFFSFTSQPTVHSAVVTTLFLERGGMFHHSQYLGEIDSILVNEETYMTMAEPRNWHLLLPNIERDRIERWLVDNVSDTMLLSRAAFGANDAVFVSPLDSFDFLTADGQRRYFERFGPVPQLTFSQTGFSEDSTRAFMHMVYEELSMSAYGFVFVLKQVPEGWVLESWKPTWHR